MIVLLCVESKLLYDCLTSCRLGSGWIKCFGMFGVI